MDKRSDGKSRRTGLSKGSCVVVAQGGPEYADQRPTDAQREMECGGNPGAMIGSVVVVSERDTAATMRDDIQALC